MKKGYPEGSNQKFPRWGPRRIPNDSRRPDVQWRTRIIALSILDLKTLREGAWNRQQTAQREQGTAMIRPEDSISRQPAQSVAGDAGPSGPSQISAQTNVEELGQAFFAAQARLEVAEAEARAAQADLQVRLAKAAAAQAHAEQLEMAVANATPLPPNDEDDLDLDLSARPAQSATGGTEAIGGLGL
ncbi:hypothetical protein H4I96_00102 [Botrytis cinerea]